MDFFEKFGETITEKGKEAADKAKELAEIARLKSRISTCEEVIKKNYLEIGKLYYEKFGNSGQSGEEDTKQTDAACFEKQCSAIHNAKHGAEELRKKIQQIKGL